ncbi:Gfo/Idh/MocA family oxidoreductase [Streptomyces sp. NPDC051172]|uniref:Gfo/Idh/MocA family protein n=1 Tax=Streptomyces sp. NPDC051172 TaxID=3155796 RepID=UPI00343AE6E2
MSAPPNHLHVGQAVDALRAGKHVVCEKPVATTAADAQLLVDAAESAGRLVTVPSVYRYHPVVRELRSRVATCGFGGRQLLHGSYLQDWLLSPESTSWRVDPAAGGASRVFADIGSHWFDLVEWVAGVRVAELLAETTTTVADRPRARGPTFGNGAPSDAARVTVTTEDALAVVGRTTEGVLVSVTVSRVSAGRKNRLWRTPPQHRSLTNREPQPPSAEGGKFRRRAAAEGQLRRRTVRSPPQRR